MDFKKILANFDAVETDTSVAADNKKASAGSMLAILESFDNVGNSEPANEGKMSDEIIGDSEKMSKEEFTKKHGKEMADEYYESVNEAKPDFLDVDKDGDKKEPMKKALKDKEDNKSDKDEVDESIDLDEAIMVSAEGDEAAQLLSILQLAGMSTPAMEPEMPAMEPEMPAMEPDMPAMDMQDEYSNSPDEFEQDVDAVIASGNDLHSEKNAYAAAQDGDNPMAAFEGKFKAIMDELIAEDKE